MREAVNEVSAIALITSHGENQTQQERRRNIMRGTEMTTLAIRIGLLSLAALCTGQMRNRNIEKTTPVNGVVVVFTDRGPSPAAVTVKDDPFLVLLHNRTGVNDLRVSLTKDEPFQEKPGGSSPAELKQVVHKPGLWDQPVLLDLEPGMYYLTARGKETWQFKITVVR